MRTGKPIVLICVFALSMGVEALALPQGLPPGRWWERPAVARELGITAEQRQRLNELAFEHARRLVDLQAAVRTAEIDVREAADAEPFDGVKARSAFQALLEARTQLATERFELLIQVRLALTSEQWVRLTELAAERRLDRREELRERWQRERPPRR